MEIKLTRLKCLRCGHEWVPRKKDVRVCVKCKSAYWDLPRIIKKDVKKDKNRKSRK